MGAEAENTIVTDESVIDRMMLESYGMTVTDGLIQRINESTARSDNEKLFGIDSVFVFGGGDAVEQICRNDVFEAYCDEIYEKLDVDEAALLLDMWCDELVSDKIREHLNVLDKGEIFRYDDFFRMLLSISGNEAVSSLVKSDDGRFDLMPHIVRIF